MSVEPERASATMSTIAGYAQCYAVIPAYNEAGMIEETVRELRQHVPNVIVVDDGSTDNTSTHAIAAGAIVLRHPINVGQGAALQTGFDFALRQNASTIITYDADGQMSATDVPTMLARLTQNVDIVLGSRFLGHIEGASFARRLFLKTAVRVSNIISGLPLTDAHCGFRAMTAATAGKIRLRQPGMAHASELLQQVRQQRLRYVEVPVTIRYTPYSRRKGQAWLSALRILWDLFFR